MNLWLRSAILLVLLGLQACAMAAGPGQCHINVEIQAMKRVNMDTDGTGLPTTMRFYQLKSLDKLKTATYDDLWNQAASVLGDDVLDTQEVVVYPSQTHAATLSVKDDANYFAVAAFFRTPRDVTWRTFTRLPPFGSVERCRSDRPGGPYYFLLEGLSVQGSTKPFTIAD
jgi:type VI secretion system VasD/TssJ family lipoprotein